MERALVLARDEHDEPQVRGDELPRGLTVALLVPADGELVLFLARQDRDAPDLGEVALQRVGGDEGALALRRRLALGPLGGLGRRGPLLALDAAVVRRRTCVRA